jgi:hypothetical protein
VGAEAIAGTRASPAKALAARPAVKARRPMSKVMSRLLRGVRIAGRLRRKARLYRSAADFSNAGEAPSHKPNSGQSAARRVALFVNDKSKVQIILASALIASLEHQWARDTELLASELLANRNLLVIDEGGVIGTRPMSLKSPRPQQSE